MVTRIHPGDSLFGLALPEPGGELLHFASQWRAGRAVVLWIAEHRRPSGAAHGARSRFLGRRSAGLLHGTGTDLTPFLLARLAVSCGGRAPAANAALLEHDVRLAGQFAAAYAAAYAKVTAG